AKLACLDPAVAVPERASLFECDAMDHAVAEEPVRRHLVLRIRTISQISPDKRRRNRAVDVEREHGLFARNRRVVAALEEWNLFRGRCGAHGWRPPRSRRRP